VDLGEFSYFSFRLLLVLVGFRGSSQGVNWPGRGIEHWLSSGAIVKDKWRYASPALCLHGVCGDNFTLCTAKK